jgi:hypothetical protein
MRRTGTHLASHAYGRFSRSVPNEDLISVRAGSASGRTVANATPGSALYNDIARWADTLEARSGTILIADHHEPEASGSTQFGSAADYPAAFRKVVTIFRNQGAGNVRFMMQLTAYAYEVSSSERRAAATWYPGDGYVDIVGGDGYNWGHCYVRGGAWTSIGSFTDPILRFARAHGRQSSLPELGVAPDSRPAQWLRDAHRYITGGCSWERTTAAELTRTGIW